MKIHDIKSSMPTVFVAMTMLENAIRFSKGKERIIKIIHGYGSTGKGGAIKTATLEFLHDKKQKGEILTFIPGEALWTPMGYDEDITKYKQLLQSDSDYKKGNDRITYVIFK